MPAGTYTKQAREILGIAPGAARREQRRIARSADAQAALQRAGYHPVETPDGDVRYELDETRAPQKRRAFATLHLASGGTEVAINPRRVVTVASERTHLGETCTIVALTTSDVLRVSESVEDAVAALEAVA